MTLPFQYQDGWFFSVGAEYQWTDRLTLRTGIGYEISPITDQVRTPLIPDNDRFWASVGASWQIFKGLDSTSPIRTCSDPGPIDQYFGGLRQSMVCYAVTAVNPWRHYIGNVNAHADILSVALEYRWRAGPQMKRLITK